MASAEPPSLLSPDGTDQSDKLSLLYYALVMIGLTSLLLVVYKFVVVEWCRPFRSQVQRLRQSSNEPQILNATTSQSFDENSFTQLISTYKYEKSDENKEDSFNNECVVCLSTFEDGQDVRQLSRCKHSFHAPCIDMWLYSHPDCPICRSMVGPPISGSISFTDEDIPPRDIVDFNVQLVAVVVVVVVVDDVAVEVLVVVVVKVLVVVAFVRDGGMNWGST
ncbi:RING-H2 finger protein ATL52-like [Papaver somniferum]|uniref:RING-H2 finger protein ATL52-like n=1 Tax=Papaver somniferum TaxID=3469 RepID=UPI000E6F8793|nr:RING-H2 finger protein ATL52-like [Papaver somniferum]